MFGLFKKPLHEPADAQRAELLRQGPMGQDALKGEDCDEIPGATGAFGHAFTNPIPVNGPLGSIKYLAKLRASGGGAVIFHRLGSVAPSVMGRIVDAYEVVDVNAERWAVLYLDPYHPRRSTLAPDGFALMPYDKRMGDPPFGYGVPSYCDDFPYGVANALLQMNQTLQPLAMRLGQLLTQRSFEPPPRHRERMDEVRRQIGGRLS